MIWNQDEWTLSSRHGRCVSRLAYAPSLFWREERVLVVRSDHPLADRDSISILETSEEIFVSVAGGPPDVVDWWLGDPRPDGTRSKRGPTADSIKGLLELVTAGAGVNIAGQSASKHYRRDELAFIPITDVEAATIVLCSLKDSRNPMVDNVPRDYAATLTACRGDLPLTAPRQRNAWLRSRARAIGPDLALLQMRACVFTSSVGSCSPRCVHNRGR